MSTDDGICIETQTVADAKVLATNDYVVFKSSAQLSTTAGVALTGGTDITSITGDHHQAFLDKIEAYSFNALCCPASDATTVKLYAAYTERVRDEVGAKFQLIAWQPSTVDYEGVIGVWNTASHATISGVDENALVACCRRAHDTDENLEAGVMLENLASKASGVLALLHLIKNAGMAPADVDFVVECSEEAVGDAMQRGGGNMAKALAEIAECVNASGFDVRGFCAGPVAALITSAGMVASGVRPNVVVVSGGSVPKLYMNARDHIKKGFVPLENCIGSFALLLTPDDGQTPVMRLEGIGKHSVGAGASPQAITSALTFEPLSRVGLKLTDVDKYAPELHNAEVTLPAGAGNVPEANYKMIAALAVMKGQIERTDIPKFVAERGMPGFAPIQGHIPSGVPYVGHAIEDIKQGRIKRAMIIGKGSLFLGRLTNLADGASFIMEAPGTSAAQAQNVSQQDVTELLLTALSDVAANLQKGQ